VRNVLAFYAIVYQADNLSILRHNKFVKNINGCNLLTNNFIIKCSIHLSLMFVSKARDPTQLELLMVFH
jgi:hypothetical protein